MFSSSLAVEDGVALGDERSTAISAGPPEVVSLAPVRCTPGVNVLGGQEDHEGQDDEEHQEFEHFECFGGNLKKNEIYNLLIWKNVFSSNNAE